VLLPFNGQIVYDGVLQTYSTTLGSGDLRSLEDSYDNASKRQGVITSLPLRAELPRPAMPRPRTKNPAKGANMSAGDTSIPQAVRQAHDEILGMTDAFCRKHLDEEYGALCRELAGILARKRLSPLTRGRPKSWASGIVRVVGWVNLLGDPSQPHEKSRTCKAALIQRVGFGSLCESSQEIRP